MARLHIQWMVAGPGGYTARHFDVPWLTGWRLNELFLLAMVMIGSYVFGTWIGECLGRLITKVI